MKKSAALITALGLTAGAYLYSVCPGVKKTSDITPFTKKVFAHRGMFDEKTPENSLEAFKKAVDNGYGIELDVQLSADGQAVVFHDATLLRLFGESASVSSLTLEQLGKYGIPSLSEALEVIDGRVPLIIELKGESRDVSVCPIAMEILDEYAGEYCVQSFNPFILKWFRDARPDIVRGQLSTSFSRNGTGARFKYFAVENLLTNFLTKPDFIAYEHKYPGNVSLSICRNVFKTPVFAWTVKTAGEWSKCADKFDSYICEGLPKKSRKK